MYEILESVIPKAHAGPYQDLERRVEDRIAVSFIVLVQEEDGSIENPCQQRIELGSLGRFGDSVVNRDNDEDLENACAMEAGEHQDRKSKDVGYKVGTTRLLGIASPTENQVEDVLETKECKR